MAPMSGFPEHPHHDADIVTYVREGTIAHEDTLGNKGSAGPGEVRAMSAGAGIRHSDRNDETVPVMLFQLWFTPRNPGGAVRWGMSKLPLGQTGFVALASGDPADTGAVQINTDARALAAQLAAGQELVHQMSAAGKGYLVPTDAAITVNGVRVDALDGLLVDGETMLTLRAEAATEIVFVELLLTEIRRTPHMSDTTFKPVVCLKSRSLNRQRDEAGYGDAGSSGLFRVRRPIDRRMCIIRRHLHGVACHV
jgi:quercetin 2,3-dioxygenase